MRPRLPLLADIVAKVENRTTLKISRKLIFELLCCCVAFQRPYGDPRSILGETIWSLTSPRVRRISGSKNFRSPPQKDFCNNIGTFETSRNVRFSVAVGINRTYRRQPISVARTLPMLLLQRGQ